MNTKKDYCQILLDFIEPICDEGDGEQALLAKLQLGRIAWNYCIAKEYGLPPTAIDELAEESCAAGPNAKAGFDLLVGRKMTAFAEHTDLILSVQINHVPGDVVLDVSTVKLEEVGNKE